MYKQFLEFLANNGLLDEQKKVLLTVSGGIDSVVMADLYHRAGFNFGIAHCNFGLRGDDSDLDQLFTEKLAERYEVPFHTVCFETRDYARHNKISIQMAARELRYTWFDQCLEENDYQYYATAHHLDDQVETFFINLLRGTGINGLTGINNRFGNCIRPIIFATKTEIENYAEANNLDYRIDKSNSSTKYLRNKIRHVLLPVLKEINPDYHKVFNQNFNFIDDAVRIYQREIEIKRNKILRKENNNYHILIDDLLKLYPLRTYTFEILNEFGFNRYDVANILNTIDSDTSGKRFYSKTHCLLKDRDEFIINPILNEELEAYYIINENDTLLTDPLEMLLSGFEIDNDFKIPDDRYIACLDYDKLSWPLKLRKWEKGDAFSPLGMDGMKKISDYFIDEKFSLFEKESTWVLESNDEICWIVGHRIDNRFKITSNTQKVLKLKCSDSL